MYQIKELLGKKIRETRKKEKMTQEKLAELAGIEIASLSNIETGKNYPGHETLRKIAEAFKIPPYELYIFEHFRPQKILIDEMYKKMSKDEELTRKMYIFFQCVK